MRDDVQVLAVCDVDTTRREAAKKHVDATYSEQAGGTYRACAVYSDFRELLARDDIDAVLIATPDHWHAYIAIAAVMAGKDVYCEKPLTYNVHEAVELVKAVRRTDRVFQVGSQQRSLRPFRVAAELVRNGVLGRVSTIHVSFGDPAASYREVEEPMEPGLDWNLWCGPGPLVPYNPMLSPYMTISRNGGAPGSSAGEKSPTGVRIISTLRNGRSGWMGTDLSKCALRATGKLPSAGRKSSTPMARS